MVRKKTTLQKVQRKLRNKSRTNIKNVKIWGGTDTSALCFLPCTILFPYIAILDCIHQCSLLIFRQLPWPCLAKHRPNNPRLL